MTARAYAMLSKNVKRNQPLLGGQIERFYALHGVTDTRNPSGLNMSCKVVNDGLPLLDKIL